MRLVGVLALTCGCNQAFGLQRTELVDSPPAVDAAPPPACPAIGTVPTFANELYQLQARFCFSYAASGDTDQAVAICNSVVSAGARDTELAPVAMTPPISPTYVRVAPEGNRLFAAVYQTVSPYGLQLREFSLDAAGATDLGVAFAAEDSPYLVASTPTRGPVRAVVFSGYDAQLAASVLIEIEDPGSGWIEKRRTLVETLGVSSVSEPHLSADGLRLVFVSYDNGSTGSSGGTDPDPSTTVPPSPDQPVYYTDRASRDEPFGMAKPLMTVPSFVQWPYLTEDCGRIYFSALNTVFYLRQ